MATATELYDQADKLKEEGNLVEAIAKLYAVIELDANYPLAHAALAVLQGKMGEHEKAIEHAQKVCELEPNDPFSFTAMSVIFQRAYAGTNNPQYIQQAEEAMARSQMIQGR